MNPAHGTRSFGSRYSRIDRCALFVRSNPYERPANPAFTVSENGRQKTGIGLIPATVPILCIANFRRLFLIPVFWIPIGGADRDRTDDLKLAKLALSQLSYGPSARRAQKAEIGIRKSEEFSGSSDF